MEPIEQLLAALSEGSYTANPPTLSGPLQIEPIDVTLRAVTYDSHPEGINDHTNRRVHRRRAYAARREKLLWLRK